MKLPRPWSGNKDVRRCPPHDLGDLPVYRDPRGGELWECTKCQRSFTTEPVADRMEGWLRALD